MAEPFSSSSQVLDTPQYQGAKHTMLPAEIWAIIFGHVSSLPGQSLGRLASVCRGRQREVERLTFANIVVRPTEDDIAMLRCIVGDSRRSSILSKITFLGSSSADTLQKVDKSGDPYSTSMGICDFFTCLGSTARAHLYPPLSLTFVEWDDPRASVNTLLDADFVGQKLCAQHPTQCRVEHIVLALEKQLWPSTMFAEMV